jgi:glucosamine-6-phosphate deaminase
LLFIPFLFFFKMRVIIRDEASEASKYVANYIIERIREFNPTPEKPFVMGLPTGSSPLGVYKALVKQYKAGKVSCSRPD